MRAVELVLVSSLGLSLAFGLVACSTGDAMSGSAVETEPQEPATPEPSGGNPVEPAQPGSEQPAARPPKSGASGPGGSSGGSSGAAGSSDPVSVADALSRFGATARVAAELVEKECGDNATCLAELEALQAYIEAACGEGSDCPATAGNFNQSLSSAQRSGQAPLQTTFPQTQDIEAVLEKSQEESGSGSPEEPAGAEEPAAAVEPAAAALVVAADLAAMGARELTWEEIKTDLAAAAPANAEAVVEAVWAALEAMSGDPTAELLLAGKEVTAADAAAALEAAAASMP